MTDIAKLQIEIEGLQEQTRAMELFAETVERAADAIERLSGQPHGGISIVVAGSLAEIEVKPVQ